MNVQFLDQRLLEYMGEIQANRQSFLIQPLSNAESLFNSFGIIHF